MFSHLKYASSVVSKLTQTFSGSTIDFFVIIILSNTEQQLADSEKRMR